MGKTFLLMWKLLQPFWELKALVGETLLCEEITVKVVWADLHLLTIMKLFLAALVVHLRPY